MNLQQYQTESRRTCPSLGSEKLDLCHMILGMVSELPELEEAMLLDDKIKIGDEAIDGIWYLSNYCTFRNYKLEEISNFPQKQNNILLGQSILTLSDKVKKYIAYNKPINEFEEQGLLANILLNAKLICDNYELNFEGQLDKNIAKLRIRYPEKFDKELAINRNLEAENKILNGK